MKRLSVREGNLPEKIKQVALNPGVLKMAAKEAEVWECRNPQELMEYCQEREVSMQSMKPFKGGNKEDSHWYVVAIVLQEKTDAGIIIDVNKILFAVATPEWLRNEGKKYVEQVKEKRDIRSWLQ